MIAIPAALTTSCAMTAPLYWVKTQWAENDSKTPRQKIGSECSPHKVSGRNDRDFSGGQSRGIRSWTTTASARKWVKRNISRSVLSIG